MFLKNYFYFLRVSHDEIKDNLKSIFTKITYGFPGLTYVQLKRTLSLGSCELTGTRMHKGEDPVEP